MQLFISNVKRENKKWGKGSELQNELKIDKCTLN